MDADLSLGHNLVSEDCDGKHKPQLEVGHWGCILGVLGNLL